MPTIVALLFSILIVAPAAVPLLLWILCIRPYLRHLGRTTITGANWGMSAWGDWTLARDAARERQESPWFLSAFPVSLLLWILCPLIAIAIMNVNG